MITDYYRTLGLTPDAQHSAIRTAYLALMRRYHPDRNPSADAAERVRDVTLAYKVLGNRDSRIDYDMARVHARAQTKAQERRRRELWRAAWALSAFAGLGLLMMLYLDPFAPEAAERVEQQAASRNAQLPAQKPVDPAALCSSASNAQLIKRELFARAAALRGSDGAIYRRLATHSVIRLQAPHSVRSEADRRTVYCNALVGLDLPPGVAIPGGRRSVSSDVGYLVQSAGGGRGSLALFHAGTIARDLATLVSVRPPAEPGAMTDEAVARAPAVPPAPIMPAPPPVRHVEESPRAAPPPSALPAPRVPPSRPVASRVAPPRQTASTRCGARSSGAASACNSPALTGLDRDLGMLFRQSVQRADAAKQRTLYRDHYGFIARLDRCASQACSRDEYLARMQEISKTMSGGAPRR
jgi:curved DNA-binding protein CbpA